MKSDWKKCTIGDICSSISETYKRNAAKVVLVNTSDVLDGKVLNHVYVDNVNLKGQFKKTFQKNDILFSEIRPANKRYAFIDFDNTKDYIASTKLMVLRPDIEKIHPLYLYFILKAEKMLRELQVLAETRSGTFPQITFDSELSQMPIMIPNVKIQRKIVSVLKTIDDKIETNTAINKNLEEQAQAIYKSWFVDFEPFGGKKSSLFTITTLGCFADIKKETMSPTKKPNMILEHYSIPAYDEKHFPVFETTNDIKSNKYIINKNSVMISKLNPEVKRIWRPMCLSENSVCSTEFIVYEAKNPAYRDYLYSLVDSAPFFYYLCSHTTGSTNSRQRATPSTTLHFEFILPTDEWIKKFCSVVTPIYNKISANLIENQTLVMYRDTLLPRLMSGEIDVSDIEI